MEFKTILFYIFSTITVLAALRVITARNPVHAVLFLVLAFFLLIYAPTMEREKANIRGRFPEAYAQFESNVPPFLPRLTPWRSAVESADGFSLALYMKHGEWKASAAYAGAMLLLALRASGRL